MYRPFAQAPSDYSASGAHQRRSGGGRRRGAPGAAARGPDQPVFDLMTMRAALHERTIGLQYLAAIMTVFAVLALVLAAVGLYAVIAYLVAQRRHEIGLRMALGASGADVLRMTVGQAFKLTLVGTGIGLALSIALSRLMEVGAARHRVGSDARVFAGFAAVLIGDSAPRRLSPGAPRRGDRSDDGAARGIDRTRRTMIAGCRRWSSASPADRGRARRPSSGRSRGARRRARHRCSSTIATIVTATTCGSKSAPRSTTTIPTRSRPT